MAQISVSGYSILDGVASIVTAEPHNLSAGDYISVRGVNSNVNGQYFVISAPVNVTITYAVPGAPNTSATNVSGGYLITTNINQSGKPAFVYDESADTWYQVSGKVNTNGNYTWTGTHLHQVPVTMEDILILSNLSASVSASPSGGGFLYVEDGALKFKGSSGTITTVAPA
jgi:hypothetical protein